MIVLFMNYKLTQHTLGSFIIKNFTRSMLKFREIQLTLQVQLVPAMLYVNTFRVTLNNSLVAMYKFNCVLN